MNKIKNTYSAPEADLLVVRFEQNIMSGEINTATGTEYLDYCDDKDVDIL